MVTKFGLGPNQNCCVEQYCSGDGTASFLQGGKPQAAENPLPSDRNQVHFSTLGVERPPGGRARNTGYTNPSERPGGRGTQRHVHVLTRQVDRRPPLLPPCPCLRSPPPRMGVNCRSRLCHARGGPHVPAAAAGGHRGWGPPSPPVFLLGITAVSLRLGSVPAATLLRIR